MAKAKKRGSARKRAASRQAKGGAPCRFRADVMTSGEMAAHRRRNGILLLPVGCFEMHGVHVGMSCDSLGEEALCRILAPEWKALIMPTIHYTDPGATGPWPGSVAVTPLDGCKYLVAVLKAIFRNGFRRVVVVGGHGPLGRMVPLALQQVFVETGHIPIHYWYDYGKFCKRIEEEFGQPHGEAALYLASLHILGRHGDFDPHATAREKLEGPKYPLKSGSAWALRTHRTSFPYYFTEPNNHVGRYPGMELEHAARAADILREVVLESARGLPEAYAKFQKDMLAAINAAPWDKL